nr:MAG TPA: hypothetical protein [Caudoviricetes sp.]
MDIQGQKRLARSCRLPDRGYPRAYRGSYR